jgi:hypothetical protein
MLDFGFSILYRTPIPARQRQSKISNPKSKTESASVVGEIKQHRLSFKPLRWLALCAFPC